MVVNGQKHSTLRSIICLWQWFDLNAMGVWKHLKCKVKPCFSAADKKTTCSSSGDIMASYFVSKIAIDRLIVQAEIQMFVNCQFLGNIHLVADNSGNVQNVLTGWCYCYCQTDYRDGQKNGISSSNCRIRIVPWWVFHSWNGWKLLLSRENGHLLGTAWYFQDHGPNSQ